MSLGLIHGENLSWHIVAPDGLGVIAWTAIVYALIKFWQSRRK